MPSVMIMRDFVSKQYGGSWPMKVARMPDYQVISIYYGMKSKAEKLKANKNAADILEPKQLSIFDSDYCRGD